MPSQSAEDEEEGKREDEEGQKRKIDKKQKTKSDLEVPLAAVGARDSLLFFSEMSKYLRTDNVNDNNYREAGSAKDQTVIPYNKAGYTATCLVVSYHYTDQADGQPHPGP